MRDRNIEQNTTGAINRRLRAIEHAASGVVLAVETLRAVIAEAEEAVKAGGTRTTRLAATGRQVCQVFHLGSDSGLDGHGRL